MQSDNAVRPRERKLLMKVNEIKEKIFGFFNDYWQHITIILLIFMLILQLSPIIRMTAEYVSAGAVSDWGLAFGAANEPPRGNVSAGELEKYGAYFIGDTSQKTIYLTFDAGYENGYTEKILDTLKKHDVKATFFLVSHYLKTQPELVKRMADEGHTVGNHTDTHPDMSKISDLESLSAQLGPVEKLYKEITGQDMVKIYRPPQGKFNVGNLQNAQQLGYTTMFWSLAYADWDVNNQPTAEAAIKKLNSRIHNGAVVLLHSTSKTNAEILDTLITEWKSMGYVFGDISDFLGK